MNKEKTSQSTQETTNDRVVGELNDPSTNYNGAYDPVLSPSSDRFVLFPLKYHGLWEKYKKHMASSGLPKKSILWPISKTGKV